VQAHLQEKGSGRSSALEVATQQTPPARRRAIAASEASSPEPTSKRGLFGRLFGR
jgi:hypothetical protein